MKTLVIAPHADDEVLGCGGTLCRKISEKTDIAWLLVTNMQVNTEWTSEAVDKRQSEIGCVRDKLGIQSADFVQLDYLPASLDQVPLSELVSKFTDAISLIKPAEILLPYENDVHSDHRIVFDVAMATCKWFKSPEVKRILAYETLSETDFSVRSSTTFRPTVFVDISTFMSRKLELMNIYQSEVGTHPFPRSNDSIEALARLRGAQSGYQYAEAFQLIYERI